MSGLIGAAMTKRITIAGVAIRTIITALALGMASGVAAHSFWLEPETHASEEGERVRVAFRVGHAGEVDDWGVYWERIASLRLFGPDGVEDQQRSVRVTDSGEVGGALVTIARSGTYALSFESNPSFSELPADRFNAYLENEGLAAIAAHREATGASEDKGTELYARRAKTIVQVGDRLSGNISQPVGQILEIVPLVNPYALGEGRPLPLQVLWRGQPLAGAKLVVSALDREDEGRAYTTNVTGEVDVPNPVAEPGEPATLYTVTWGVPARNDARADYFTIFASLTVGPR